MQGTWNRVKVRVKVRIRVRVAQLAKCAARLAKSTVQLVKHAD